MPLHCDQGVSVIRQPGAACTLFLLLCRIQNLSVILHPNFSIPQTSKSKIPKTPKIQNSKSPNLGRWGPHIKICYITVQNPRSKIPTIQNPKSPKSKIPKIQNPQDPKSKIHEIWGRMKICYITVQNPKSPKSAKKVWILDWGTLDFGFRPQNPKSPRSKIQNPQNPKSPRSKIQNPQNPKSQIFRQNPKFGALRASHKELLHNDPKSKIQNHQNADFGDFGFGGFWIVGILDFGDFGVWIWWILDCGNFGFRGFWSLDFGDFGFWGFWCFWGGPGDVPLGNLVTVLGGQRLESPLVRLSGTVQNQLYLI